MQKQSTASELLSNGFISLHALMSTFSMVSPPKFLVTYKETIPKKTKQGFIRILGILALDNLAVLSPALLGPSVGNPNKIAVKDSLEWSHPNHLEMIGRPMPSYGFAIASLQNNNIFSLVGRGLQKRKKEKVHSI